MKTPRKLLALITALFLICSMAVSASAAENASAELIAQMINYYRYHQDAAQTDIARLNTQLSELDAAQAEIWTEIMDYWSWVNREMTVTPDVLPDGLPEDDSLCIVVLGYALNRDGTMQDELIGRLETALASARKYPNAYILCTGGGTASGKSDATEAGSMAQWLTEQGVSEDRIIVEDRSRTTAQNAQFSCAILSAEYPQVAHLALVTSDYHLARGHVLFFTQSRLSGCGYDIVGNVGFDAGHEGSESIHLQSSDVARLAGVEINRMEEPALSLLTGITVGGSTSCEVGCTPVLTVTASYDSGFTREVTGSTLISGLDLTQAGTQTVTLVYCENGAEASASVEIEVLPPATETAPPTESPTESTVEPVPAYEKKTLPPVYPVALMIILIILLIVLIRKRHK